MHVHANALKSETELQSLTEGGMDLGHFNTYFSSGGDRKGRESRSH